MDSTMRAKKYKYLIEYLQDYVQELGEDLDKADWGKLWQHRANAAFIEYMAEEIEETSLQKAANLMSVKIMNRIGNTPSKEYDYLNMQLDYIVEKWLPDSHNIDRVMMLGQITLIQNMSEAFRMTDLFNKAQSVREKVVEANHKNRN